MKNQNGVPFADSVSVCAGWVPHLCVSDNRAVHDCVVTSNYDMVVQYNVSHLSMLGLIPHHVVTSGYVRVAVSVHADA